MGFCAMGSSEDMAAPVGWLGLSRESTSVHDQSLIARTQRTVCSHPYTWAGGRPLKPQEAFGVAHPCEFWKGGAAFR